MRETAAGRPGPIAPVLLPTLAPSPPAPAPRRSLTNRAAWTLAVAAGGGVGLYAALSRISAGLTGALFGTSTASALARAFEFFVYDTPKVLLLLAFVVFAVGVARTFVTPERTRRILAGERRAAGYPLAALLGVLTPFCSCSAVPLFIGFVTAGVPLGVTFAFLVSAPMVNEVALALLFAMFGWRVAVLYMVTGLAIAMLSGWTIGRLRMERHVEGWVFGARGAPAAGEEASGWRERGAAGLSAVAEVVGKVWPFVVAGIAVGAAIHGWVPEGFLAGFMGRQAWWAVPLAVLLGVPLYSGAAGMIPIVQSLLEKGAALGTVLAFMMAVVGLSLPEAIILRRVLKLRLIVFFFGVVATGILLVGYLFNALL